MLKPLSLLLLIASVAYANNPNCTFGSGTYSKSITKQSITLVNPGPFPSLPVPFEVTDADLADTGSGGSADWVSGEPDICIEIDGEDASHDFIDGDSTTGLIQGRFIAGTGTRAWDDGVQIIIWYDRIAAAASTEDEDGTYPSDWEVVLDYEQLNPLDHSGYARNTTDSGTTVLISAGTGDAGPTGNAIKYNTSGASTSDFAGAAWAQSVDATFTVFAMTYPTSTSAFHSMFQNVEPANATDDDGWRFGIRSNAQVMWDPIQDGISQKVSCPSVTVTANTWQSLAMVVEAAGGGDLSCWNGATKQIDIGVGTKTLVYVDNVARTGAATGWVSYSTEVWLDSLFVISSALDDDYISEMVLATADPASYWEDPPVPPPAQQINYVETASGAAQLETDVVALCDAVWAAAGMDNDPFDRDAAYHKSGDAANCFDLPFPDEREVP